MLARAIMRRRKGHSRILKSFPARLDEITQDKDLDAAGIEVWFADVARIGQKNKVTRRWGKRGTHPSAPHDQRTASAYIFGAVCPAEGKGAGLVLPSCNSEAMALHLKEISIAVAPGAHAILLLDEAGWHISTKLLRDVDEVQFAESARSLGS